MQNPNRIGKLQVPKGMHWITVFGGVTCKQAIDGFKVFLGRPSGDLPSPWRGAPGDRVVRAGHEGHARLLDRPRVRVLSRRAA